MERKSGEKTKEIAGEFSMLTQMIQAEKKKCYRIKSAQASAFGASKKKVEAEKKRKETMKIVRNSPAAPKRSR